MKNIAEYLKKIDGLTERKYHKGFELGIKRHEYFATVMDDKVWKIIFKKAYKEHFMRDYPTAGSRFVLVCKSFAKTVLRCLHLKK